MLMNGINKCLKMLHVGVTVNAVAKVCYVASSAELEQHFFS